VNGSTGRQGLWSVPGDGVLARQGDLILLSAIDDRGLLDKFLDLLAKISEGGGDGRSFADAVGDLLERAETWGGSREGEPGPAVITVGPAGAGLAVTVSGTAWAELTTEHGKSRLAAGQPAMVLRCVVGIPVRAVRGGLGTARGDGDRTDLFSRLDRGTVRAGGLSYHTGLGSAPVTAPPEGGMSPEAAAPSAQDVVAPQATGPDPAAGTGGATPGPAAEEAAVASERPYLVELPAMQPGAEEPPGTESGTAEPGTAEPRTPELGTPEPAMPGPATAEPGMPEPGMPEPWAAEPVMAEPIAVEPAALPQPDPGRPPTEQVQVPGFGAAPAAQPFGAAVPVREPTGPADVPPLPFAGLPGDGTEAAAGLPGDGTEVAVGLPGYGTDGAAGLPGGGAGIAAGAPIVLGVYCKNGHFGDPDTRSCAVCGASRNRRGQVPQPGPRPPLGALVLDDGSALELNGDCVVGREPTLDPSVMAGEASPLCIIDDAVSRVHARIHLDGWRVLLVDLGSANGTRIRPPGKRSDQALEPHVPVPIQGGTRVLVGRQGFQYESHRGR
jgi:FHA domain